MVDDEDVCKDLAFIFNCDWVQDKEEQLDGYPLSAIPQIRISSNGDSSSLAAVQSQPAHRVRLHLIYDHPPRVVQYEEGRHYIVFIQIRLHQENWSLL
jgi:hypothetical protein